MEKAGGGLLMLIISLLITFGSSAQTQDAAVWDNTLSAQATGGYIVCAEDTAYIAVDDQIFILGEDGQVSGTFDLALSAEEADQAELCALSLADDTLYFRNETNGQLWSYGLMSGSTEQVANVKPAAWSLVLDGTLYYSSFSLSSDIQAQALPAETVQGNDEGILADNAAPLLSRCPTADGIYYSSTTDRSLWWVSYDSGEPVQCTTDAVLSPVADRDGSVYYLDGSGTCYNLSGGDALFGSAVQLYAADNGYLWCQNEDGQLAVFSVADGGIIGTYGTCAPSFQLAGQWYFYTDLSEDTTTYVTGALSDDGTTLTRYAYAFGHDTLE